MLDDVNDEEITEFQADMIGYLYSMIHDDVKNIITQNDVICCVSDEVLNTPKSLYIWFHKEPSLRIYIFQDVQGLLRTVRSYPNASHFDFSYVKGILVQYDDDEEYPTVQAYHMSGNTLTSLDDAILQTEIVEGISKVLTLMKDVSPEILPDFTRKQYIRYHFTENDMYSEVCTFPECTPFSISFSEEELKKVQDAPKGNEKLILLNDRMVSLRKNPFGSEVQYAYVQGKKVQTFIRLSSLDHTVCAKEILSAIIEHIQKRGKPRRISIPDESYAITLRPYLEALQIHVVSDIPLPNKKYAQLKRAAFESENPITEEERIWYTKHEDQILGQLTDHVVEDMDPRLIKLDYYAENDMLCDRISKEKD